MKKTIPWLALRMMRRQKLRVFTILLGLFLSSVLLTFFGGMGNEFWNQVHTGSEDAVYDYTQNILIGLAALLLLLVIIGSAVLMKNLFSLTFLQKWNSLKRLISLGAKNSEVIILTVFEIAALFLVGALSGIYVAFRLGEAIMGYKLHLPVSMICGVVIWLLLLSMLYGVKPAVHAVRRFYEEISGEYRGTAVVRKSGHKCQKDKKSFFLFMATRYLRTNKGGYFRIAVAVFLAICLYVPASFLISTNLDIHKAELNRKFGIRYYYNLKPDSDFRAAFEEYKAIAAKNQNGDSTAYVEVPIMAGMKRDNMSHELLKVLKEAGWNGDTFWTTNGTVIFLEDGYFTSYINSMQDRDALGNGKEIEAVLYNGYINRTVYSGEENSFYPEVDLLNSTVKKDPDLKLYCESFGRELSYGENAKYLRPDTVTDKLPPEFEFNGNITVFLPLSQISDWAWLADGETGMGFAEFYGFFEDMTPQTYEILQQNVKEGSLFNDREITQEWYDSMGKIHLVMNAVCIMLFGIALLNVAGTMIFQYAERKRGLAVLWSLGQSENELLKILILENVLSIILGFLLGIPITMFICYNIYQRYRDIWRIGFAVPVEQLLVIAVVVLALTVLVILLEYYFIRREDFLKDIRNLI